MSKQLTTRWYISAWIVSAIAWLALLATTHNHQDGTSPAFYLVLGAGAILMLVFWIGALFRLAQLNSWGWFVAVLRPGRLNDGGDPTADGHVSCHRLFLCHRSKQSICFMANTGLAWVG
ncbi:MAG: hypothetical protein AUI42_07260 [Actinobacteria bacterium 13_1_40CM_2_65_8]|nr:MAG: hypothetical protein AUI42_07260 [Actinobacteria bacterium 13_1_40CM_2_65_8]